MMSVSKSLAAVVLAVCATCSGAVTAAAVDLEDAQYNVVVTLYNAGQWEAALKKIQEREARDLSDPMRIKYLYARGLAWEKGGKTEEAARAYAALVEKYPEATESVKARLAGVFIQYAVRDYAAVLAAVPLIKPDALSATERQQLAVMTAESWLAKNELKQAVTAYGLALQLGADRASVHPRLFNVYYQLGMNKELVELSADGIPGLAADTLAAIRAQACFELGQFPQAEAEARKVPTGSENLPRASFSLAQALIKQDKLADAIAPLQLAIAGLQKPPVPPSAHLALVECLLAAGQVAEAKKAVQAALERGRALPAAEFKTFRAQAALLTVRIASKEGDNRKLADAVVEARPLISAEQLPELLYARLFALHEMGDTAAVLASLKDDKAVFEGKPQEGPAVLLYAATLKQAQKSDEADALLDAYVQRQPHAVEALRARVELAALALNRENYPRAAEQLRAVLTTPEAAAKLGAETFAACRYNSAIAAAKTGDAAGAMQTLHELLDAKPAAEFGASVALLLGQTCLQANDTGGAVKAWRQALAFGQGVDEADIRDRIGRLLLAAGDAAGARAEYDALEKLVGGAEKMPREACEASARARYAVGDFAAAAAAYEALQVRFKDAAVYAYEAAVCLEKMKKWAEAERGYAQAEKNRNSLPPEYAAALTENLNRMRFQAGTGDRGLAYWVGHLNRERSVAEFDAAAAALCRITDAGKQDREALTKLDAAQGVYSADDIRYYAVGAVRLHAMAALEDAAALRHMSVKLADAFSAREKTFTEKSWGTTVAPAMICFYRGEGERRSGNHAEALAAFETVLAAYPYNEWPDAAACGAADCYVALGDTQTALAKLNEVVKAASGNAASATWVERATKRIAELTERK